MAMGPGNLAGPCPAGPPRPGPPVSPSWRPVTPSDPPLGGPCFRAAGRSG
jgi:hypothetical protein